MRHMYKVCREYGRRMASYRGEIARDHPQFAAGSAAAVPDGRVQAGAVGLDAPDISYTAEDDKVVETHIKANSECLRTSFRSDTYLGAIVVQTAWHSVSRVSTLLPSCLWI